jgi:predicted DsbA family dithiol-disulfide isomerase
VRERLKDPNNPLKLRAAAAGLKMVHREIIPSTRLAHQAAEFAREHGKLEPFQAAVLRRYWSESQDIGKVAILREAATEAGLDADALEKALTEGTYRQRVEDAVDEAREMGVAAVPTFLVADKLAIQGAQDLEVFREAMRRIGAKPRSP